MTTPNPTPRGDILVGIDGSPSSEHAVSWAAEEAHLQHRGLILVHARTKVPPADLASLAAAGIPPRQVYQRIDVDAQRIVARARALVTDRFSDVPVEDVMGYGDARRQLLEMASGSSMVVVGTRGHGPVVSLLLGSVSGALVRHSEIPVAVIRPRREETRGVLIAADGSPDSLVAVEAAYREASQRRLPLTIGHCMWDALMAQARWSSVSPTDPVGDEARIRIAESVAGMTEKFPDVTVDVRIASGAIDAFIVDMSQHFELLVIGRPPRTLGQRLTLSGLTTSIAEHAHSSVLVVP